MFRRRGGSRKSGGSPISLHGMRTPWTERLGVEELSCTRDAPGVTLTALLSHQAMDIGATMYSRPYIPNRRHPMRIAVFTPFRAPSLARPAMHGDRSNLSALVEKILSEMPNKPAVQWVDHHSHLPGLLGQAEILLVILPVAWEAGPIWMRALPALPTLVLTEDVPSAAILFRRHRILEFVRPTNRLDDDLDRGLRLAYSATTLGRAVAIFSEARWLSPTFRRWAIRVLQARPPYAKISNSTGRTMCASSVQKEWHRKIRRSSPKEFLRWVLVANAAGHLDNTAGRVNGLANELQVSPGILDRAARSVLGVSLRDLPHDAGPAIRKEFRHYVDQIADCSARTADFEPNLPVVQDFTFLS